MAGIGQHEEIILYHYNLAPNAWRVVWYLTLRGIKYKECIQPMTMPRKDLKLLGINYRRIPVLAIGRDVYCDTILILNELERRFPDGRLGSSDADGKAIETLLQKFVLDGGVFGSTTQLIPTNVPLMRDPTFIKDREDLSGRRWDAVSLEGAKPKALVEVLNACRFLESTFFSDGRKWILGGEKPQLADIEGIWPLYWVSRMKGALPSDLISERQFPNVFSWINRFHLAIKDARAKTEAPEKIGGSDAANQIFKLPPIGTLSVSHNHPLAFKEGDILEIWPIDTGSSHKDRGKLVLLTENEIGLNVDSEVDGQTLVVHFPLARYKVKRLSMVQSQL